ncbi:hypothetical protein P4V58_00075 [Bacillus wiedmannii]|uniref:hypothetical protein n=1 Tax=Bacillus wiedmannii TaxID=1890302 RepID=UPI002E2467BC|nr:hypothetical protein [Bacillus wiedmannii]
MSSETAGLDLRLRVKEQWFCDNCGEVIESDQDGMLEWDSFQDESAEEYTMIGENFRIVHHRTVRNCSSIQNNDALLSDGHLDWFTGTEGLSKLLSIQARYKLDTVKFQEIIRRLHIDYYEEARRYLSQALADGQYDINPSGNGHIPIADLIWLIETYGDRQE